MIRYFLIFFCCFKLIPVQAQDPQYSQYYANALYLSPAFAGAEQSTRGIFATRHQWPGLDASFFSCTASFDHYFPRYKSGVGLIVSSDMAAAADLNKVDAGLIYSYQIDVSPDLVFTPGLQLSYVNSSIGMQGLTFASQYDKYGFVGGHTNEEFASENVSYADISAGGLLSSDKFWAGFATHHLNRPNQSFMEGKSRIPVKTSFFGGMKFSLLSEVEKRYTRQGEEISISPTFLYKMQGKSDQLDIGLYGRYNALVLGAWYRGIPVKVYKPEKTNHDAVIVMAGIVYNNLNIGYSFDLTLSKLTMATGGSHEVTVSYRIASSMKNRTRRKVVCPKF